MAHAKIWQHVQQMAPNDVAAKAQELTYVIPVMGALASNPNVTRKDVIKSASNAVADGKVQASMAVQLLSQMPDDPEKLQSWLKSLYQTNLAALVHIKAAQMPAPQTAAPAQAPVGQPLPGAPQ